MSEILDIEEEVEIYTNASWERFRARVEMVFSLMDSGHHQAASDVVALVKEDLEVASLYVEQVIEDLDQSLAECAKLKEGLANAKAKTPIKAPVKKKT